MPIRHPPARKPPPDRPRHGLARVLSKLGVGSRTQASAWIVEGRVTVGGRVERNPERPTDPQREAIAVDGLEIGRLKRVYLAVNKPRGLVVTAADEKGRDTVYALLEGAGLPWLGPVGRLDKASEGLLLMSNDTQWAAAICDPERGPHKTYHVQINAVPDSDLLRRIEQGVVDSGEPLQARQVTLLRSGERNAWLEIVLDEGRNRQIRRLLAAFGLEVLRLVRVAIGPLKLGELPKRGWRHLSIEELEALAAECRPLHSSSRPAAPERRRRSA